jgi:hypothetical protein
LLSQLATLPQSASLELLVTGTVNYRENAAPVTLAAAAGVLAGADFAGGQLTVSIAANADVNDRLRINNLGAGAGQIGLAGSTVTFEGTAIGTLAGGLNGSPLVVTLNANADSEAVKSLVRNVNFRTLSHAPSTAPRTITWRLSDGEGGLSALVTTTVNVVAVNDAPVLDTTGSPMLDPIDEDTANSPGTFVKDFASSAIQDLDAGAVKGIAVMSASAEHGTWQFTLDNGATWQSLGQPTTASALLLPADDDTRIRFIPERDFHGETTLTYRAWDQTRGVPGGQLDALGNTGGVKSLSKAFERATLAVRPINDNPVLGVTGTVDYVANAAPIALSPGGIVRDVDSPNLDGGRLRVRITTGAHSSNRLAIGGGFAVDAENNVTFGGTIIGRRISSGVGVEELVVAFNANANPGMVQTLVRAINFRTVGGPLGTRSVLFTLSDGDGGTSPNRLVTVNVEGP